MAMKRMIKPELSILFLSLTVAVADSSDRHVVILNGELRQSRMFIRGFGDHFAFVMRPDDHGWNVSVHDDRGTVDIAKYTTPWHGINATQVHGWHFRNSDNTGPNDGGPKNVNAPQEIREFYFSPEVDRTFGYAATGQSPTIEDVERMEKFGKGVLEILDHDLTNLQPGQSARFTRIRFKVTLSWPVDARKVVRDRKL